MGKGRGMGGDEDTRWVEERGRKRRRVAAD